VLMTPSILLSAIATSLAVPGFVIRWTQALIGMKSPLQFGYFLSSRPSSALQRARESRERHRCGHAITEGLHSTGLVGNFRVWVAAVTTVETCIHI
jgi:hypothetical protein